MRVERERLVSENVSRHETQELAKDGTSPTFRTVEIVERVLEKEVLNFLSMVDFYALFVLGGIKLRLYDDFD